MIQVTDSSTYRGLQATSCQQLQPIRMLRKIFCFPHKLKHSNGAKDWLILNKTFKTGNDSHSLMTREIGYSQMKQITFIWIMLESDSYHHTFHQSTQYHMMVGSKAHWGWGVGVGLEVSAEPSLLINKTTEKKKKSDLNTTYQTSWTWKQQKQKYADICICRLNPHTSKL